jgi:hypothetical protein
MPDTHHLGGLTARCACIAISFAEFGTTFPRPKFSPA